MRIKEAKFEVPSIKPSIELIFIYLLKHFLYWLNHQAQGSVQKQNIIKTYIKELDTIQCDPKVHTEMCKDI